MLQRLPREFMRGQVIFLVLMHRGDAVRVRGEFVEFGCSLVPVICHGRLPLNYISQLVKCWRPSVLKAYHRSEKGRRR